VTSRRRPERRDAFPTGRLGLAGVDGADEFGDEPEPVLHAEPGSTWWPVLWGPAFAVIAMGVEGFTGAVNVLAWAMIGLALMGTTAIWVQGRRRICSVQLTPSTLRQGRERLAVKRIAEVDDVGLPVGGKVLGGGWNAPRGTTGLPIRLDDGSVVLGWARDVDALRRALHRVLPS
jgi:hypothetical protein